MLLLAQASVSGRALELGRRVVTQLLVYDLKVLIGLLWRELTLDDPSRQLHRVVERAHNLRLVSAVILHWPSHGSNFLVSFTFARNPSLATLDLV